MIDPVVVEGIEVSSTKIRHRLLKGDVDIAAKLLGRPYTIQGTVVHGEKRGAALGYPTANLELDSEAKLIPENGIYVVTVEGRSFEQRHGLASIGVRPTFHTDGPRTVEVYIMDADIKLYGSSLTVGFLHRLRGEEKFGSEEDLIRQMDKDKEDAVSYLGTRSS